MEIKDFYILVERMRRQQERNLTEQETIESVENQIYLEFLVDIELIKYSGRDETLSKTPITFKTFSQFYCPN